MKKITVPEILARKNSGKKITMVTAYDYPTARIVDEAGIDIALIGDSLGMVVRGEPNTLNVTLEEMVYHTRMVARGTKNALVVGDMPFLSFQISVEETVRNAGRFIRAGAEAVKIEGGAMADRIRALREIDIPVMGHIGLTPQSVHRLGGYRVQGRSSEQGRNLLAEAKAIAAAGAFAIVLEGIPLELGRRITKELPIPTIGIGAGPHCDGQVLVFHDLLGLLVDRQPTFVKRYADLKAVAVDALRRYKDDVENGKFPTAKESYQ